MKTNCYSSRNNRRGVAVVVVLAIIGLVAVIVATNLRALTDLSRDMRLIEKKQIQQTEKRAAGGSN